MDPRIRDYYAKNRFGDEASAANWPPDAAGLEEQLRSAILKRPMPGKKQPFPLSTAWGNFLYTCWRLLESKPLATDPPDAFAVLPRIFADEPSRELLLRVLIARVPFGNATCVLERQNKVGEVLGLDWFQGMPGVLTYARMLRGLGLRDESNDLAFEAWNNAVELAAASTTHPVSRGGLITSVLGAASR